MREGEKGNQRARKIMRERQRKKKERKGEKKENG